MTTQIKTIRILPDFFTLFMRIEENQKHYKSLFKMAFYQKYATVEYTDGCNLVCDDFLDESRLTEAGNKSLRKAIRAAILNYESHLTLKACGRENNIDAYAKLVENHLISLRVGTGVNAYRELAQ